MKQELEDILNGKFNFTDEDVVISNLLELFDYIDNIMDYLNKSTTYIPSYETFKVKINTNKTALQEVIHAKKYLKQENSKLLYSEEQLQRTKEEFDRLQNKIERLKELDQRYARLDIHTLNQEYQTLFLTHQEKYKEIEKIEDENKKLKQLINNFDKNLLSLNDTSNNDIKNMKTIFGNIEEYINEHWDHLDHKLSLERKRFKNLTDQYNKLLSDVDSVETNLKARSEELEALHLKYAKLTNIYHTHFEQNRKYSELNSSKLDSLVNELEKGLKEFDDTLSDIVNQNEKIKTEISNANA